MKKTKCYQRNKCSMTEYGIISRFLTGKAKELYSNKHWKTLNHLYQDNKTFETFTMWLRKINTKCVTCELGSTCCISRLSVDPLYTVHWLLILSTFTVYPVYIDCWPSLHWLLTLSTLLILSTLTVDPLSIDCWPSLHFTLTVDPLYIDCWPSLHWLLTLSALTVDPLYTVHWLLTLSTLYIDCWSSLHSLLICPPTQDQQCQLLIHPGSTLLIVDLPQVNTVDWPPPGSTVLIIDPPRVDTVDRWSAPGRHCRSTPCTDFNFVIFNILINHNRNWLIFFQKAKLFCVFQFSARIPSLDVRGRFPCVFSRRGNSKDWQLFHTFWYGLIIIPLFD